MISRIYIDNYRCFEDFEYRPSAMQLLVGPNGTGKSTVFDILDALRRFIVTGTPCGSVFPPSTLTAWDQSLEQTFELGLRGEDREYGYRLVLEQDRAARKNRIFHEEVRSNERLLYQFDGKEVTLFRDDGTAGHVFPFDSSRSAITTIPERSDNTLLSDFRRRMSRVFVFSPEPLGMKSQSDAERRQPDRGLHQLSSWIRHLHLESPEISQRLTESLRQGVLDHFVRYRFVDRGEGVRSLRFEFDSPGPESGRSPGFYLLGLGQLSTGQRTAVALYTLLHAAVGEDSTLCVDEPDNYLALREIQPWLIELTDRVRDTGGQCLLISHHPELINYLAPDCGVQFFRDDGGPVRVQPFEWSKDEALRPDEVVARGWENP